MAPIGLALQWAKTMNWQQYIAGMNPPPNNREISSVDYPHFVGGYDGERERLYIGGRLSVDDPLTFDVNKWFSEGRYS